MQYFIGIVPPDEYLERVVAFQKRWLSNGLPNVVEPHVTVKAQSGLTLDMAWLEKVKVVCSSFSKFQLALSEPALFGNQVIFLSVQSNELLELHKKLVNVVTPSKELMQRYAELDLFTPHLTLGQTYWGMKESEILEMKSEAGDVLAPFPTFTVSYVRVYKEVKPNKYQLYEDIKLA
ncbi:2'-5' RNA ligase family protein [Paenibacillus sp. V4I7]|uniref:2'-5' RNA ligase family protein n=1 Tax=Paenibacillus sp. V4I7 TaxID=3042307 RepID=UPI002788F0B1|nr:2'-5' RNA ligase family protein [Paenibacillus sp. V4I7]MDQ0898912.1 2'-5' RNA ligase [Paenibacillus sp. V4I7]